MQLLRICQLHDYKDLDHVWLIFRLIYKLFLTLSSAHRDQRAALFSRMQSANREVSPSNPCSGQRTVARLLHCNAKPEVDIDKRLYAMYHISVQLQPPTIDYKGIMDVDPIGLSDATLLQLVDYLSTNLFYRTMNRLSQWYYAHRLQAFVVLMRGKPWVEQNSGLYMHSILPVYMYIVYMVHAIAFGSKWYSCNEPFARRGFVNYSP
jgi:hypothetical protein